MIPFCNANAILKIIIGGPSHSETLNDDYDWHLKNAPIQTPDPWPMRLLPGFLRTPLKARIAARKYEKELIALWENSPHLLDDIGVVLSTNRQLPENHVLAPDSVIEHVRASTVEHKAAAAALAQQDQTPKTPAPAPAAATRARTSEKGVPAGLPA
jgi:hypothetical protein